MISDGGKSFESNKKKNVLETGMGEWLEKTSLNKGNVSCFLNEKVEPAICASGAEVFQAEEPGSAKFLWWEQIWLCSRNREKASVAGIQQWIQCVDWDKVKGGAGLIM